MKSLFRLILMISVATAVALGQASKGQTGPSSSTESKPSDAKPAAPRKVDRGAAYYHYALAHMYEEQVTMYGRSEAASKAIEQYLLAIEGDPCWAVLTSGRAETYV